MLRAARRLLTSSGRLVVFDVDIASLTVATDAAHDGTDTDAVLHRALGANPRVMRAMPALLADAECRLRRWRTYQALDVGRLDYWASGPPAWRVILPRTGVMTAGAADAFVDRIDRASADGRIFATAMFCTYLAQPR